MNEQQNTALVQRLYKAFSQGDIQTIVDNLAEGVEWTTYGPPSIPYAGTFQGPAKVREFFHALASTQENQALTTDDYIAQGDKVVSVGRYSATVKATGKKMDSPIVHVFTIRDGKVTRFIDFLDTAHTADAYAPGSASTARK